MPSQLTPMIPRELKTLILSSMMQALACRVRTYSALGQRAGASGMVEVSVDLFLVCSATAMS